MHFKPSDIPGAYEVKPTIFQDIRGSLIKVFQDNLFSNHGMAFDIKESYFSSSKKNVLRGFHFQLPPYAHDKMVCCIQGKVLDVLVDLRTDSPMYGKPVKFNLSGEEHNILYIPKGVAHAFFTLSDTATLSYYTSTVHQSDCDSGVLWSSFDIWPIDDPITSDRDQSFKPFEQFISPFRVSE